MENQETQEKQEETKQPGNKSLKIGLYILLTAAFLMVVVLLAMHYMNTRKTFISKEFDYTLEFDSSQLKYEKILLNSSDKVYMDRFGVAGSEDKFYLAVNRIDASTDIDELMEAFESDDSYSFTREEDVAFGAGDYKARRISYEDTSGTVPVKVYYYYDAQDSLLFTVCTDEAHKNVLEKALSSVRIGNR